MPQLAILGYVGRGDFHNRADWPRQRRSFAHAEAGACGTDREENAAMVEHAEPEGTHLPQHLTRLALLSGRVAGHHRDVLLEALDLEPGRASASRLVVVHRLLEHDALAAASPQRFRWTGKYPVDLVLELRVQVEHHRVQDVATLFVGLVPIVPTASHEDVEGGELQRGIRVDLALHRLAPVAAEDLHRGPRVLAPRDLAIKDRRSA